MPSTPYIIIDKAARSKKMNFIIYLNRGILIQKSKTIATSSVVGAYNVLVIVNFKAWQTVLVIGFLNQLVNTSTNQI